MTHTGLTLTAVLVPAAALGSLAFETWARGSEKAERPESPVAPSAPRKW